MKKAKFKRWLHQKLEERLSAANKHEVEQKFRILNPEVIRKKLRELGAVKGTSGPEHNEVYDLGNSIREKSYSLRLRYHGADGGCLTLKGPRLKGLYKKRLEIETPVQFENMKQILLMLGYRIVSVYRKQREEYITEIAKVCIDHLPNVGWFCEIEGRPLAIRLMAKKLKLERHQREDRSYRKLLKEGNQIQITA